MNIEKISGKIKKLLNVAENVSASQGEIDNAVAAATRLMSQHNLTRDDIDLKNEADPTKGVRFGQSFSISKTFSIKSWERDLMSFVCQFIGFVSAYETSPEALRHNGLAVLNEDGEQRKGCFIWFYGAAEDSESAVELFEELRDAITVLAVTRYGTWSRGDGAVFAEGFCMGLIHAHKKAVKALQVSNEETRALMAMDKSNQLVVKKNAKLWLANEHGISLHRKRGVGGASGSDDARRAGFQDGSNYPTERPSPRKKLA